MTQPAVPALIAVLSATKNYVEKNIGRAEGAKTANESAAGTEKEMARLDGIEASKIASALGNVKAVDALNAAKKKVEEMADLNSRVAKLAGEAAGLYKESADHLQTSLTALAAVGKGGA